MAVSGFETWPYYYGRLGVSWTRPILYRSDLIIDKSNMEASERETFLAVFGTDLVAIALVWWLSKKWRQLEAIHWLQHDQSCCPNNASKTLVRPKNVLLMHVFIFWYEKNSLDNTERQWVVDDLRQPKKSNEQFDLPRQEGKFKFGSLHGVPALRKRTLAAMNVWLSCKWEFLVNFCAPDRPLSLKGDGVNF